MKTRLNSAAAIVLSSMIALAGATTRASDHLDAPMLDGNGGLDVNDLYAFKSPTNPANTVLIMTVNPFIGTKSTQAFGTNVAYRFNIDNNGDALPNVTYTTTFGPVGVGGVQTFTVNRQDNSVLAAGNTGVNVVNGPVTARAGTFDDPFFFDLAGFKNNLMFTGVDAFAGANITAIVLEVPSSELGGPNVGVWVTTSVGGVQKDRVGRPAINTVLIPVGRKDEFNGAIPSADPVGFGDNVRTAITSLSGSAAYATTLTGVLLPDVLTLDTSSSASFLNGRKLADDVIDAELNVLTNGAFTTGDGVAANDRAFSATFPYLASANAPEPAALAMLTAAALAAGSLARRRSLYRPDSRQPNARS